ncbi:alpha-L-rhamnosidase-related protein [Paenibacillus pasadenensis]|uniref:alpha-L-rhamnosidase-related protein n=1 Tax=Paenibacillus TaxID=44249 RepID=UPI00041D8F29|nr:MULTISPECIES: hypothetical protein [Paenibacillus]QGG56735.1 glycogen debranching protein [Paenibacillus sp. B01]
MSTDRDNEPFAGAERTAGVERTEGAERTAGAERLRGLQASRRNREGEPLDLFVAAGTRSMLIGAQDGGFPDFGHHIPDEMGGLWAHPIKLLDGFWVHVAEAGAGGSAGGEWLQKAEQFRNYAYFNEHVYTLPALELEAVRSQFCPDGLAGLVVELELRDRSGRSRELEVVFQARSDLRPVWFSEQAGVEDAPDEAAAVPGIGIAARDTAHPWTVVFGAETDEAEAAVGDYGPDAPRTAGPGAAGHVKRRIELAAGGTARLRYFVAGSSVSEEEALASFRTIRERHAELRGQKRLRYEEYAGRTTVELPDERLVEAFDWAKVHAEWLHVDVPGVGRGLAAGIPEYPWWFGCDNSYALPALLTIGRQSLAIETSELIREASAKANGNGRILHELTTLGVAAHPGNAQETPHFISCVWEIFCWTGDRAYLQRSYPAVRDGLEWLFAGKEETDDLLPLGYGIIEIEGLNVRLVDTAVYAWKALKDGAEMAELVGEGEEARRWRRLADRLERQIDEELWLEEEGLYADAVASVGEVRERLPVHVARADAMEAPAAARELERLLASIEEAPADERRAWLFKNWVVNTPLEAGLAPREKALRALDRLAGEEFSGPDGMYLSGMYRTQMMTISTAVQAVAEARYGRMDEALRNMGKIAGTLGRRLPGSISEMSPDYGCFVQAWTGYGLHYPLVRQFFGVTPRAHERRVELRPRLPEAWKEASLDRLLLGGEQDGIELAMAIRLGEDGDEYRIELSAPDWTMQLSLPCGEREEVEAAGADCRIVGRADGELRLEARGGTPLTVRRIRRSATGGA